MVVEPLSSLYVTRTLLLFSPLFTALSKSDCGSLPLLSSKMPIEKVFGPGSYPGCHWVRYPLSVLHGVCSSVGRVPFCESGGRGIVTHHTHRGQIGYTKTKYILTGWFDFI